MYIEESFELFAVGVTNLNKKMTVYSFSTLNPFVIYKNLKTGYENKKDISLDRFWQFLDKHRGKNKKGFNRPSITTRVYNSKTGKEVS